MDPPGRLIGHEAAELSGDVEGKEFVEMPECSPKCIKLSLLRNKFTFTEIF